MNFIKKYNGKSIEDWGAVVSSDFRVFVSDFKKYLSECLPKGGKIVKYTSNHYDLSGFIQKENNYYYFSYEVPRGEIPLDLETNGHTFGFLVRKAKDQNDYRGENNNFCSVINLKNFLEKFCI